MLGRINNGFQMYKGACETYGTYTISKQRLSNHRDGSIAQERCM
jgi:hypothetical protein